MAGSAAKGKSNLLRKVEERALAKKLKEQNNVVSYLPNELISNVLLRLPLQSLSSMRYVSKQWYDVISDPDFINSHLRHSESVLIFRKKIPSCPKKPLQANQVICKQKLEQSKAFSVEAHLLKMESVGVCLHLMSNSMQQFSIHFVEFKEGKKEIMNYGLGCSKNIRATCNGLILLDNGLKEGGLIVMNPVTRKLRPLPVGTLCPSDRESYGFAYNEVAGEYKVVHLFFDELRYIGCETLCLGTMRWRAANGPSFGLFQSFDHNPVSAIGALHWIPQVRGSLYLVSMELKNDKFHRWSLPKAAGRHDRIIKKGDFLCFVTREHSLSRIDMWIRKGLFRERWTLHHRITKGFFPGNYFPVCSMRISGDIIFMRHVGGEFYVYDERLQEMKMIVKEGCGAMKSEIFLNHVNSLVSWERPGSNQCR